MRLSNTPWFIRKVTVLRQVITHAKDVSVGQMMQLGDPQGITLGSERSDHTASRSIVTQLAQTSSQSRAESVCVHGG